ncbi:MAG: hypothetical protein RLY21_2328 [Planctomycetota bacterium]
MIAILLANAAATFFMTGLIWFVQIVHYPLFAAVGSTEFPAYSRLHQSLTTFVVGPPMLVEAITAGLLVFARPTGVAAWLAWSGLALVGVIWLSTALLQIPAHGRLASGFSAETGALLVSTNWIRTVAWSLRGAVVVAMLWQALAARGAAPA